MNIQPRLIEFDSIIAYICLAFALIAGGYRNGQECSGDETYGSDLSGRTSFCSSLQKSTEKSCGEMGAAMV